MLSSICVVALFERFTFFGQGSLSVSLLMITCTAPGHTQLPSGFRAGAGLCTINFTEFGKKCACLGTSSRLTVVVSNCQESSFHVFPSVLDLLNSAPHTTFVHPLVIPFHRVACALEDWNSLSMSALIDTSICVSASLQILVSTRETNCDITLYCLYVNFINIFS